VKNSVVLRYPFYVVVSLIIAAIILHISWSQSHASQNKIDISGAYECQIKINVEAFYDWKDGPDYWAPPPLSNKVVSTFKRNIFAYKQDTDWVNAPFPKLDLEVILNETGDKIKHYRLRNATSIEHVTYQYSDVIGSNIDRVKSPPGTLRYEVRGEQVLKHMTLVSFVDFAETDSDFSGGKKWGAQISKTAADKDSYIIIEFRKLVQPPAEEPPEEPPVAEEPPVKPETESEFEACDEERHDEEIREVHKIQDAVTYADEQCQKQKAKLGIMRIAAGKKRNKIIFLESYINEGKFRKDKKQKFEDRVEQLKDELYQILKKQDEELKNALYNYDDALRSLRKLYEDSKCDDVKKVLEALEKKYLQKRGLVELELLLASSDPRERGKFHALARKYLDENKYKDVVLLMRAMDYVEKKDPRSALFALRKALKENPDNKLVRGMLRQIELGYLRAIDGKITGEAAAIRAQLWGHLKAHGEAGFLGALKDIVTTGVTASSSAIGGKPMSLADLASTIGDEATVQHAGLITIIRLRDAGIPLAEITSLNNEQFVAKTKELFKWNLTREQALKIRFSVNMAFKNADVKRLSAETKQVFDIDRGKTYFNSDAFDSTWEDWIGDVVNIKNVVVMLGPSSVISSGGKLAIHGSKLAKDTLTVRDAFSNLIRLPQLADKFAKGRVGQACISELFKFEQNTGLVSKVVAEALIQQGLIKTGEFFGGKAGALAAEALSILGVGDIDQTLRILKQNGITPKTLASLAKKLRKAAEGVEQIGSGSKKYVNQLDGALQETAGKGALSPSTKKAMKESQEEMEESIQKLMRKAKDGDISLADRHQLEQMKYWKEAFDDAMSGNRAGAKVAKKTVENMEEQSRNTVMRLTKDADTVDDLANNLKKSEPELTLKPKDVDADTSLRPRQKSDPLEELTHNDGLEGPLAPKQTITVKRVRQEANRVKEIEYFQKVPGSGHRAGGRMGLEEADGAMLRQDYDGAVSQYKKLYMDDGFDHLRPEIATRFKQAKAAKEAAEQFNMSTSNVNKAVTKSYSPKELDDIAAKVKSGEYVLERIEKPTAAKPYWLKDAKTGEKIAVLKPHDPRIPNNWDIKGEVLRYRVSQQLNNVKVKTPAAAKINLDIDDNPAECAIIRYVRGSDLEANSLGVQYTVKRQVAEDKAISTALLSHDRHSGNLLIDEAGDAMSIDHGYNGIGVAINEPSAKSADGYIKTYMNDKCINQPRKDLIIRNLENQITYNDMDGVVSQLENMKNWDENQFRKLLDGIAESEDEMQKVMKTLRTTSENLRQTMQDNFPTIDVGPVSSRVKIKRLLQANRLFPFRLDRWWPQPTLVPALPGGVI
jgi:hypothetical protein